MKEIWRSIVGFEDLYQVSNLGRVRSRGHTSETMNRWGLMWRFFPGRILVITCAPRGYPQVTLCDGAGGRHQKLVHNLVAEAFIGPRPVGKIVLHRDGTRLNCAAKNLRYGTHKQNSADAIKHGAQVRGERQGSAKLTEQAVLKIRAGGMTNEQFAAKFGVRKSTVAMARRGDSWKHLNALGMR